MPHDSTRTGSFKPDGVAFQSDAPFDGNTLYRTEYTHKEIDPCPAALVDTHRSGYVFDGVDEHGHKVYVPITQGLSQQQLAAQ